MSREPLAAAIFDVDGTLVDSERDGHRLGFNAAFAAHGLPYRWDVAEYGELLAITGGRRRIAAYLKGHGYDEAEAGALAAELHRDKTEWMRDFVSGGGIAARPGVRELLEDLVAGGVTLAVATTGTRDWVEPLLANLFGTDLFELVVTGSEIRTLKPDPAVYHEALAKLSVPAERAVAVEDSSNGLRAALGAGLDCVVVTNDYTRRQDFTGAVAIYPGFAAWRADRANPLLAGVRATGGEPAP